MFFVNIIDILNKLKKTIIPFSHLLYFTVIKLPYLFNELLPLIILLSSLFIFDRLAKRNELSVIMTSGLSFWRIIQPIIIVSIFISIIDVTILQSFASVFLSKESYLRNSQNQKTVDSVSIFSSGIYVYENIDDTNRFYISKISDKNEKSLLNATILILDSDYNFKERIEAAKIIFMDNEIYAKDCMILNNNMESSRSEDLIFKTNLTYQNIINKFQQPEYISFWDLGNMISELENSGISASKFIQYYYKLIFKPIYVASIVLVSICFISLNTRKNVSLVTIGIGGIVGIIIHIGKEIFTTYLIANNFSSPIAQLLPIIIIFCSASLIISTRYD